MMKTFPPFRVLITLLFSFFISFNLSAQDAVLEVDRVLDKESVKGITPDWDANTFTVALRFRPTAAGEEKTNGNGMLFACGSGWFDGFRAHYDYSKTRTIRFEIGRGIEKSAIGVQSQCPVYFGILNDVVCTYDGATLRLYVNGELEGEMPFSGGLTPNNAQIAAGFGGYGVGSVQMYIDRVEYWKTALDAEAVKARFAMHPEEEREKIALWNRFHYTEKLDNFIVSPGVLAQIAELPQAPFGVRENLLNVLIARKFYNEALPILAEMTKEALLQESPTWAIPENETLKEENVRISNLFTLITAWKNIPQNSLSKEDKELEEAFFGKYADQVKLLNKIYDFDAQMSERVNKIDAQAVANWQKARQKAEDVRIRNTPRFYISPNGCDENDGSATKPFKTLKKALTEAVALQRKGESVQILVKKGTYQTFETTEIVQETEQDATSASVKNDAMIYIHPSMPEYHPVFTAGQELRGFEPVKDPKILARLPESVRGKVLVASLLRNGITDFGTLAQRGYGVGDTMNPWTDLYVNGKPLTLSRYPNMGEENIQIGELVLPENERKTDAMNPQNQPLSDTFQCDDERVASWDWTENNDIWTYGLWRYEWASQTVPVKGFDVEKKQLKVGIQTNARFGYYFMNVLEELDQPGEYYLDRKNGLVYFLPPEGVEMQDAVVEFPVNDNYFLKLKNMRNVVIQGLTFTCTRGTALWLENCESVYINDCHISQCGVHALVMNGGHDCGIYGSELVALGSCGVRVSGGNRETLEPCRNFVRNCHIHDFCRIDRSYAPAVHAMGVGIVMTNNLIYDSPHHAFRTEGNDLLIARNEVHSVVYEFSDQSGIDIYCDPSYRGIVIRDNFWHHIGSSFALCGQAGIRLDDSISGVVMTGNIFYRSAGGNFGGIQIHGGKDNIVARNLFVDCKTGISFSRWDEPRFLKFVTETFGKQMERCQKQGVYPFADEIKLHVNRNYIFQNEFANCEHFMNKGDQSRSQLCLGNRNIKPIRKLHVRQNGVATPEKVRTWITSFSKRDLSSIGIQQCPLYPMGQQGIIHDVTPHFWFSR